MTLQEAKNEIAKNYGYNTWEFMMSEVKIHEKFVEKRMDEVATLFAEQFKPIPIAERKGMDVHGLTHLINILYREDDLNERIKLFYRWSVEKPLSLHEFSELQNMCTVSQVKQNKQMRYGK